MVCSTCIVSSIYSMNTCFMEEYDLPVNLPQSISFADGRRIDYLYAASADPINLIDPTGKDIWEIDQEGYVFNYDETIDYDKIIIVDKEGKIQLDQYNKQIELLLTYQSIIRVKEVVSSATHAEEDFLYIKIHPAVSKRVFEFLASNTDVEWSHFSIGIKAPSSHITTSHDDNKEYGGVYSLVCFLDVGDIKINFFEHSHPAETSYPSGLESDHGDIQSVEYINGISKQTPVYRIFLPKSKKYIKYDINGIIK